jgi:hypothetical protein
MYERRGHRLLAWPAFLQRAASHFFVALALAAVSVGAGTVGYHVTGELPWTDAFLNASMILSGMGPVDRLDSSSAKIFASLYALFSGLMFVGMMGIILAPWLHRMFHKFHIDDKDASG